MGETFVALVVIHEEDTSELRKTAWYLHLSGVVYDMYIRA